MFRRINYQIKCPKVRVVKDGMQLGIFEVKQAREMAFEDGKDLVEVAPNASPPVCSIMDYGKFRYDQDKKKKKKKSSSIKELKLRPVTGDHDVETKGKLLKKFLEQGKIVKITVRFKGRELGHKDEGFQVINKILEFVKDCGKLDSSPRFEGKNLVAQISPNHSD